MAELEPELNRLLREGFRTAKVFRHNGPQGRSMFVEAVLRAITAELADHLTYTQAERKSFREVELAALPAWLGDEPPNSLSHAGGG